MPRMNFSTIQTRIKDITNVTDKDNLIKDAVQWGLDLISSSWNWPHLMEESFITTIAPYTTGTVDVTNGSATVFGTDTTFTSAMVGRKIRIADEEAYYRISAFVSVTEITLEVPYQGTTATAQTYSIFKDEYRLPPNLDKLKIMRQIEESVAMVGLSPSAFDIIEPTPKSEGSPQFNILVGSKRDTYTTGTLSGAVNTSTLTGVDTAWTDVDGLGKGSRITIGTNVYTIEKVDSDTQLTLYEKLSSAVSVGTSYEILMDNLIIQFYDISDAAENIYFRFQRMPEVLYNDEDIPDLPDQWHHLLVDAGVSRIWEMKDKEEAREKKQEFFKMIELMKQKAGYISEGVIHKRRSISEKMGSGLPLGPRPESNYGTSWRL